MARTSPIKFLQEVRAEGQKVTWPTRRETAITTADGVHHDGGGVDLLSDLRQIMRLVVTFIIGWSGTPPADGMEASIMTKRWYIVQAYSNFEQKVAEFDPRAGQAAAPRALLR